MCNHSRKKKFYAPADKLTGDLTIVTSQLWGLPVSERDILCAGRMRYYLTTSKYDLTIRNSRKLHLLDDLSLSL